MIDEIALQVMKRQYLRDGETPEEMFWRVACTIARVEKRWGENVGALAVKFYNLMVGRFFLPNSPTLMNAGLTSNLQQSACFVLSVEDSVEGIFEAVKRAAIVHQSGGGTGFDFSRLRPKGSPVKTSGGVASGPVSFMRVFDSATEAVKQGGRRRGASMGVLRVDHPDILEFAACKLNGGFENFNISVAITDEFVRALGQRQSYELRHAGQVVGSASAQKVFDVIVDSAWRCGDPGVIFIDRINDSPANPVPIKYRVEATNPCGELPAYPDEACNLGSINLARFHYRTFDWDGLETTVRLAVRFLNDVIEANNYPFPEIAEMVYQNRRIGLGVMGWADLLYLERIPYSSEEAVKWAAKIMEFINEVGHSESERLAAERGAFENFSQSIYCGGPPLRNATVTAIAPTGTLSIIAGCSSGIEPVYALAFTRSVNGESVNVVNPIFEQALREAGLERLMANVRQEGSVAGMDGVPQAIRDVFVTAHDIAPEWHVRVQATFQKYTDNAVSKTVNLPHSATRGDVSKVFLLAYRSGCLGVTVYRDCSKNTQMLSKCSCAR